MFLSSQVAAALDSRREKVLAKGDQVEEHVLVRGVCGDRPVGYRGRKEQ